MPIQRAIFKVVRWRQSAQSTITCSTCSPSSPHVFTDQRCRRLPSISSHHQPVSCNSPLSCDGRGCQVCTFLRFLLFCISLCATWVRDQKYAASVSGISSSTRASSQESLSSEDKKVHFGSKPCTCSCSCLICFSLLSSFHSWKQQITSKERCMQSKTIPLLSTKVRLYLI